MALDKIIAKNKPTTAGIKYVSAIEAESCVGAGVGAISSPIVRKVVASDGPYDAEPANLAIIWYLPGTSGVNAIP